MSWPANRKAKQGGFTLLEMVVVVTIVMIITGVVISYVPAFRDRSGLDLVAQEIAINVRGAQVFASGGKTLQDLEAFPDDRPSYGIFFDKAAGTFSLFANLTDLDDIKRYNEVDDDIQETRELSGLEFKDLCASKEYDECGEELSITYIRPSTQAEICLKSGSDWTCGYNTAQIVIQSPRSQKSKVIEVYFNGQISVDNV